MKRDKILSLKYRPNKLSDVVGQEVLVRTLTNAINMDRLPHAILLTGIRGVGKTSTSRIIALSLNCDMYDSPTTDPCGQCVHCRAIMRSAHEDVVELDAASNTGVDNIKAEIIESSRYKPVSSRYKIFIIDEVHMLSKHAFNALLKTLEEPPRNVFFILATTEIKKVPVTVVSRCHAFTLSRIHNDELVKHMQNLMSREAIVASDRAMHLIASHSGGSIRDALMILDGAISYAYSQDSDNVKITDDIVREVIGRSNIEGSLHIVHDIITNNVQQALDCWRSLYHSGADPYYLAEDIMEVMHVITCINMKIKLPCDAQYTVDFMQQAKDISSICSADILILLWQVLSRSAPELKLSDHANRSFEMLVIKLVHIRNVHSEDKQIIAEDKAELNVNIIDIQDFDYLVQICMDKQHMLIYHYLHNKTRLINFVPGRIELDTHEPIPTKLLNELKACLKEWTGKNWIIDITENAEPKGLTLNEQKQKQLRINKEKMVNHQDVKKIMDYFPGSEITNVKPKYTK